MYYLIILLFITYLLYRIYRDFKNQKNYPDFTTNLGNNNPYFDFKDELDFCDDDGKVSTQRLIHEGFWVLKVNQQINFDPEEPTINKDQVVVVDPKFETLKSKVHRKDLVVISNGAEKDSKKYEESFAKVLTIHKDGYVTVIKSNEKKKIEKSCIIGKIIRVI